MSGQIDISNQWLEYYNKCYSDCIQEGGQTRRDAEGTIHAFHGADLWLCDPEWFEQVEQHYPDLRGDVDAQHELLEGKTLFCDLPVPIRPQEWEHAMSIEIYFKPKRDFIATREHLKINTKFLRLISGGQRILVRSRLMDLRISYNEIMEVYEPDGFYKLMPTNTNRSALELSYWPVQRSSVRYGASPYETACDFEVVDAIVNRNFAAAREVVEDAPTLQLVNSQPMMQSMNDRQKVAIRQITRERVVHVQGPPGTGKTHVVAAALSILYNQGGQKILLVCSSHAAADVAFTKLREALDRHYHLPADEDRWQIARYMSKGATRVTLVPEEYVLRDYHGEIEANLFKARIAKIQILVCVMGAVQSKKVRTHFGRTTMLLLDECSTVPSYLTPVLLHRAGAQLVMVGDDRQLNAVTHVQALSSCEMESWRNQGGPITTLNVQFRMHPAICQVVSHHFYENELVSAGQCDYRTVDVPKYDAELPINVVDVSTPETVGGLDTMSFTNFSQTNAAYIITRDIANVLPPHQTIRVLCAYRSQANDCARELDDLIAVRPNVSVHTIDQFQGGEGDVVIIVTSRSNPAGIIGHCSDVRRLNVALSRARCHLIIIADVATFANNQTWKDIFQRCENRGTVFELANIEGGPGASYSNARRISIQNKLDNPFMRTVFLQGVFYSWTFEKYVAETLKQHHVSIVCRDYVCVPSKEKGLYQGGPSGNFLFRCDDNSYEQLVQLHEALYTRPSGRPRTFKVFPAVSNGINPKWWKSDVIIVRGMSNRASTEAYKIALGHLLPGITIRYFEISEGGRNAIVLVETVEQAAAAARRNHAVWDFLNPLSNNGRYLEIWQCLDDEFAESIRKKARDAGNIV